MLPDTGAAAPAADGVIPMAVTGVALLVIGTLMLAGLGHRRRFDG